MGMETTTKTRTNTKLLQYIQENQFVDRIHHDANLSFETFKEDDNVYVYFPVKNVGCSLKFTSFWRGPFKIIEKISDFFIYNEMIRSESFQIIHVNRIKKAKAQELQRK